jgi:hypothetical protein
MSQYFSRLAERSGVVMSSHALQPKPVRSNETTDWSEQSSEVIAQPDSYEANSNLKYRNPIGQSASAYKENFSVDAAAEIPETQHRVYANSIVTTEPSNIASRVIASDFISPPSTTQWLPHSNSMASETLIPSDLAASLASSAYTTKHEVSEPQTIAVKPMKKMVAENLPSALRRQVDSINSDETANCSHSTASTKSGTSSAEWRESNRTVAFRNDIINQSTARIAAQPAQLFEQNETISGSSSRSSVQIRIGKIELEIHAPTKPVARAPQPAKTSATPAKTTARNTVFNPHRHYLRSR